MVIINLKEVEELQGKPLPLSEELDFRKELKNRNADLIDMTPIRFEGHAQHWAGLYIVSGKMKGKLELYCSRCLTDIDHPLNATFEESFVPENEASEITDDDDDDDIHRVDNHEVMLDPYLKEHLLLSIPYVPLCDEACKGLCPVCGQDQNERECDCDTETIDPRLADLAKFFEKD